MKPNTLTVLENLHPGDVFCLPDKQVRFIKADLPPIVKRRNFYPCQAYPVFGVSPKPFPRNTEVVYLTSKKNAKIAL